MTDFSDLAVAAELLSDPSTSPNDLALIAEHHRSLHNGIALHPAAYDELLDWLSEQGNPDLSRIIEQRRINARGKQRRFSTRNEVLLAQPESGHPHLPRPLGPEDAPERYTLTELKSRGGEGELWLGTVKVGGRDLPVAVKILHNLPGAQFDKAASALLQQAELLRFIDHPNIVKTREGFIASGRETNQRSLCLVMNYVPGDDVVTWVGKNPGRGIAESTRIVGRVAAALEYLHTGQGTSGAPVLHRDLKPANVIVEPTGGVRLVDFGVASFAESATTVVGTPQYMAPEVVTGSSPNAASDRYGLGAIAYFLYTGSAPNPFDPAGSRARLLTVRGVANPSGFADHVMEMLTTDPISRPVGLVAWAKELDDRVGQVNSTSFAAKPEYLISTGENPTSQVWSDGDASRTLQINRPVTIPVVQSVTSFPTASQVGPTKPRKARTGLVGIAVGLLLASAGYAAWATSGFGLLSGSDEQQSVTQTLPPQRGCVWSPEGYSSIRSQPDIDADVIRVVYNSDCLLITGERGEWRSLADGGWIDQSQFIGQSQAVVAPDADAMSLRTTPNCDASVLTYVPRGAVITVTGSGQGGWYPVNYNGTYGWLSGFYLRGPGVAALDHKLCS